MTTSAPTIDPRTADDIVREVRDLIKTYAPAWQEFDSATGTPSGVSRAMIGVFARFAEIIIQRLNQVPDKNFLAFLDLLGAALLPPQPARVPLTFFLAAGSTLDGLVPAGTQVAAPPAEGEKEPTIFETERELTVTAATLASLFVRDPEQDKQANLDSIISDASQSGEHVFQGNQPIQHILYLAHARLLGFSQIADLRLVFTLENALFDSRSVVWELWDGSQWRSQTPSDNTQGLRVSGRVALGSVTPVADSLVNGISNRWLRVRLRTPITLSTEPLLNMVRATQLPKVREVRLEADLSRPLNQGLSPVAAFSNAIAIDLGKDFFPFGEKPKLNDTLYLASAEAFSKDSANGLASTGATVQLDVRVANSHLAPAASSVRPSPELQLAWECWDGTNWLGVGASAAPAWLTLLELDPVPPTTADSAVLVQGTAQPGSALTVDTRDPAGAGRSLIVGDDGRFAGRVPLAAGINVLTFTASFKTRKTSSWAVIFTGAEQKINLTASAPDQIVNAARVPVTIGVTGSSANSIRAIRVTNGRSFEGTLAPPIPLPLPGGSVSVPLEEGRNDLLIEGLDQSGGQPATLAATTLSVSRIASAPAVDPATGFSDGTYAFCQSGIVSLRLPALVAPATVNGLEDFWLRVRLVKGDYGKDASYKLKNPETPADGFTLVLESFHPPLLSGVKIGYNQALAGAPEQMLAFNNSTFASVTSAKQPGDPAFEPFVRAPEERPTIYIAFALPPDRASFPNRTISVYARVPDLAYGEKTIPIAPERSENFGAAGAVVRHTFEVTNSTLVPAQFTFSVLGTRWPTASDPPLESNVLPGESRQVHVDVNIPADAPLRSSDRGFLKMESSANPGVESSAEFITFAIEEAATDERLQLAWEYWNGREWSALRVLDGPENFTRSGLIEFLAPPDFSASREFGQPPRYWLRARWEKGEYSVAPRLRRVLLNTTTAVQMVTARNEVLGSSDGSGEQKFRPTRSPVLLGQQLEVREPEVPPGAEQQIIMTEEGADAITVIPGAAGRPKEIWVRWHEVQDFYASGSRNRHYVLNHVTGEIRFGDGTRGLIPPAGVGNIRLARYQTGGGNAGNRPARAIVQLKTTLPYVDKTTNTEAAAGGADVEAIGSLLARAPRTIRHGGRAVTVEDYEDLAMLASPEVARAKCVPLRNLSEDPFDDRPPVRGEVGVIIVPRSREARPQPSLELLARVQDYLEAHSVPTAHLSVVGPPYLRVEVTAEVSLASLEGAGAVELAVQQGLAAFLHPLTGGQDGEGWDFGREPHLSDVYSLIETVPGVDHVRSLAVEIEDDPDVKKTGRFLVFSGTHTITLVFEEG